MIRCPGPATMAKTDQIIVRPCKGTHEVGVCGCLWVQPQRDCTARDIFWLLSVHSVCIGPERCLTCAGFVIAPGKPSMPSRLHSFHYVWASNEHPQVAARDGRKLTEGCHVSGAARSWLVVRWESTVRTHEGDGEHGRGREDAKYSTVAINVAANRFGARGLQVESCKMRMGGRHYTLDICASGHSNSTRANATSASSPVSSLHHPFSSFPPFPLPTYPLHPHAVPSAP